MIKREIAQYVNQMKGVTNGGAFCGAAVVAMITGDDYKDVAFRIGDTADDMKLVDYLRSRGYVVDKIVDGGSAKSKWAFAPLEKHFQSMRDALDDGRVILYHFAGWDKKSSGHYAVCIGYSDNDFIFKDPAGDRTQGYFNDDGDGAIYSTGQLRAAGIKRLFSVKV